MSLFEDKAPGKDPTNEQPAPSQAAPNEVDQLLDGIKNEKGERKYTTVAEAIKALEHSQRFINELKTETQTLRETLKTQEQLKELLQPKPVAPAAPAAVVPSVDDIVAVLEQREQVKAAQANQEKVRAALVNTYGAEYKKTLSEKTAQLGLTPGLVDNMAATSPEALLKLLEVKPVAAPPSVKSALVTDPAKGTDAPSKPKFDPFKKKDNKDLDKWKDSSQRTLERLKAQGLINN